MNRIKCKEIYVYICLFLLYVAVCMYGKEEAAVIYCLYAICCLVVPWILTCSL